MKNFITVEDIKGAKSIKESMSMINFNQYLAVLTIMKDEEVKLHCDKIREVIVNKFGTEGLDEWDKFVDKKRIELTTTIRPVRTRNYPRRKPFPKLKYNTAKQRI